MPGWSRALQQIYLRLDRRVLGIFRAAVGAVLLYDLLRRFPDAGLLWSSDGVLSSATLQKAPQDAHQVSFLFALNSANSVRLAFAGLGGVFLLYGLGLFTKLAQVLALAGYTSLNARNLFFEDGGTSTLILLLGWTLLLPLGDRFSLDALRRDAALPRVSQRVRARAAANQPLFTLAALAVLLQASVIYWFNAVHKSGHTWRAGDAVHLVLWQHRVNTPLALWVAAHEPAWLSPLLSSLTKRTEYLLPLLLLWPSHPKLTRPLAFLLAALLHGGIALFLTLGPFSYAMICLLWLAVPGDALDEALRRSPRRPFWWLGRLRARCVLGLRRHFFARRVAERRQLPAIWRRRRMLLREAALSLMLLVEGANVLASNRAVPKVLRPARRAWLLAYKPYLRGFQGWTMFAPDAPTEDGTLVCDALTASGHHVDPFTGREPDFEQVRRGLVPHSIALSDYFFAMRDPHRARYRRDLGRYLKKFRVSVTDERLRSAEFWWVSYVPPARGSSVPGPLERKKLWSVRL